ncbi:MAG: EamA family transporter [Opitutaceae bacterium]
MVDTTSRPPSITALSTRENPDTTSIYYLHLVFALVLSHLLLGESYTVAQLGGATLIVAGSLLGMRAARSAV